MNYRSQQLLKKLLSGDQILYTRVYTTFLMIPAEILNNNEKVICLALQSLASMTYLQERGELEFNNDAIHYLTGIPIGTINRIMPQIENKIAAANNWLADNNFTERLQLTKLKAFQRATIYIYEHTPPVIKERLSAAHTENTGEKFKPAGNSKIKNECYIDTAEKSAALALTKLAADDLQIFHNYTLERIKRNVRYFLEKYVDKDKPANYNLFAKTIQHDYGKTYLSNKEKAIEYLKHVQKAIEVINGALTDEIKNNIKKAYKFNPPADPAIFENKSDILQHCKYKLNDFGDTTKAGLKSAADAYYNILKRDMNFMSKAPETLKETAQIAAMVLIHDVIDINKIYKLAA